MKKLLEQYWFVLLLFIGAFAVQLTVAWLSKNPFNLTNFAIMIPFILIAQFFVTSGYHYGTENTSFIFSNILWTIFLLVATLVVNYFMFGSIPGALTMTALILATAASAIAATGK